MEWKMILNCTLALIALINPISKIFIVIALAETSSFRDVLKIVQKASVVAAAILVIFALAGQFILINIFHVNIYAFMIAGGIVLVIRGFLALEKGVFFEFDSKQKLEDMSIVPLASPMIAGPAAITASVSFPSQYGLWVTVLGLILAVLVNFLFMLSARHINKVLVKYHVVSALIRITGLIVVTIGIQMITNGVIEFIKANQNLLK